MGVVLAGLPRALNGNSNNDKARQQAWGSVWGSRCREHDPHKQQQQPGGLTSIHRLEKRENLDELDALFLSKSYRINLAWNLLRWSDSRWMHGKWRMEECLHVFAVSAGECGPGRLRWDGRELPGCEVTPKAVEDTGNLVLHEPVQSKAETAKENSGVL
jgi:hypothetical protein